MSLNEYKEKIIALKHENALSPQNLKSLVVENLQNENLKDVFVVSIEVLKELNLLNDEYLMAVIEAFVDIQTKDMKKKIEDLNEQKRKIIEELDKLNNKYFENVDNLLEEVKIIADEFDSNVKSVILQTINELTSQNEKAIFQMQKNIKNEVKAAFQKNEIDEKLNEIVIKNVQEAIKNSELTISQAKEIFKRAILSIKEISEELGLDVEKNVKTAIKVIENFVVSKLNEIKESLDESQNVKDFIQKDIQKRIEELETIYIGMIEAVGEFSKKSEVLIQIELEEMKRKISELKEQFKEILIQKIEMLKEESEETLNKAKEKTKVLTEEMKEKLESLSSKIAKVTKGAINGMIEGAKRALEEEK